MTEGEDPAVAIAAPGAEGPITHDQTGGDPGGSWRDDAHIPIPGQPKCRIFVCVKRIPRAPPNLW